MRKMHFEISIRASPEEVWNAIVDDKSYREWTSPFHEGSFFEDDLNVGEMELLEILSELEEMFQVELVSEQENIVTVQDLIDLLSEKID